MKRIILIISLISFGLFLSNNTYAQGCDAPSSDEGVQVFGYIQTELNTHFQDETVVNFQFRRARIGVMGNIPYDFSYYVMLETSQFLNPSQTGPFLLDAFITYSRFKYFKISAGSFKYRFGRELSMPCHSLYTIRRARSVDELTGGILGGNRDLGIMFLGGDNSSKFQYQVSLTNGYGVFETENNNLLDAYALVGRIVYQPIEGLFIGASAGSLESPSTDAAIEVADTKFRFGFDAQYSFKNFTLFGEYIDGEDQGSYTEGGGCDGVAVTKTGFKNSDGFYVMGVYRLGNFEPVYKFEGFNTSTGEEGVTQTTDISSYCHTVGINYYPNDWTRIQMNYIYSTEDPTEIKNDALMVQLQIKF